MVQTVNTLLALSAILQLSKYSQRLAYKIWHITFWVFFLRKTKNKLSYELINVSINAQDLSGQWIMDFCFLMRLERIIRNAVRLIKTKLTFYFKLDKINMIFQPDLWIGDHLQWFNFRFLFILLFTSFSSYFLLLNFQAKRLHASNKIKTPKNQTVHSLNT